jgi:hypothetical protein
MDIHIGSASFEEMLVLITAVFGWIIHVHYAYKVQLRRLFMWSQGRNGVVSWIYAEKTVVSCFLQSLSGFFIMMALMAIVIPEPIRAANKTGNLVFLWGLVTFNMAIAAMGPALHWITNRRERKA